MAYEVEVRDGILSLTEIEKSTEHLPASTAIEDLQKRIRGNKIDQIANNAAGSVELIVAGSLVLDGLHVFQPSYSVFDINPALWAGELGLFTLGSIMFFALAERAKSDSKKNNLKLASVQNYLSTPIRR